MRVLLLEGEAGASCSAALDLADAGHTVARCHARDEPAFPCRGLTADACPLDEGDADAVVVVRAVPTDDAPEQAAGEDGARCALRRRIPLVLAGDIARSPLGAFATAVTARPDQVVEAVEAAARAPSPAHEAAACAAFATVLEAHGLDPSLAAASVIRDGGRLRVELTPTGPVPSDVMEMAAVRAAGAIRSLDRYPRIIDVVTAAG